MFRTPLKTIFKRAGVTSGKAYSTIRSYEKKLSDFDKSLGGVPGDLYRMTPLSLTYQQTIVPAKKILKASEKVFGSLGEDKVNKSRLATGLIEGALGISEGTNDFVERTIKSNQFNNLYRSPFIQNYLTS